MELRLIPEFSGDATQNVVEWLEKADFVCNLRGIVHLESVIPLRLTGGAFAVYQQLPDADKRDSGKITKALRTAFAVDSFTAYEQFVGRRLQPGETVDVFLAELRRLAVPFGGLSDKMLACAFVAGLPDTVKQLLGSGSRMDELPLSHILRRARDCLLRRKSRGDSYGGHGRGAGRGSARCYRYDGLGHFASWCQGNENGGRPSALVSNPGIV